MAQPTSQPPTELHQTLNNLLEKYLNLLHKYHTLQQTLGSNLSSGFLSLAAANFSPSTRFRYGQDFYDERMRALNLISINPSDNTFALVPAPVPDPVPDPVLAPVPHPAPEKAQEVPPRDPLTWFGILVPAALRRAQESFKAAVEKSVVEMATVVGEMREMEIEIRRTRKRMRMVKRGESGVGGRKENLEKVCQ